jgi:hypothetical protein
LVRLTSSDVERHLHEGVDPSIWSHFPELSLDHAGWLLFVAAAAARSIALSRPGTADRRASTSFWSSA